ncbi:hypothetical protein M408DRAFT_30078 [Serendipita vermifera MAFF 305830]|uniref:Uncharacterized protein n=1 Tax=Serendipita vermifera MAFF 305830 TaxID=933852 RepID=A0A0C3ANF9_SERVB|nr:hypothetical protein M408DRAFT_30078 [Serendipita vermifera MAFF 305830]
MSRLDSRTLPGNTFHEIKLDHDYLDSFIEMIAEKLAIDERHLKDLKSLEETWNPNWNNSGIWPLISPLLNYFREEISRLERSIAEIVPRVDKLKRSPPLDEFSPPKVFDDLEPMYQKEQDALKVAHKIDSGRIGICYWGVKSPYQCLVLDQDRNYRRAVWRQHKAVDQATSWYTENMPTVLENHQQRTEDVKSCVQSILIQYSGVSSELSASCSTSIRRMAAFSSTTFISLRHDQAERERSHILLRKANYMNPLDEFHPAQPLLGLGPEGLPSVILRVIEAYDASGNEWDEFSKAEAPFDKVFELERKCIQSDLPTLLKEYNRSWKLELSYTLFMSDLPLLVIADGDAKQYRDGIPRSRMKVLLNRSAPSNRAEILLMMVKLIDVFKGIKGQYEHDVFVRTSRYLTHRKDAANIIKSIWRKWDIMNDSALPDGVERNWDKEKARSSLIWAKTRESYSSHVV